MAGQSPHASLTGSNLHWPRGLSTAPARTVPQSNGDGTMEWVYLSIPIQDSMEDASMAQTSYIPAPVNGKVISIYLAINDILTTDNQNFTFSANGITVPGVAILIPHSGSAAGQVFSLTDIEDFNITLGGSIGIISAGGSSTPFKLNALYIVEPSG